VVFVDNKFPLSHLLLFLFLVSLCFGLWWVVLVLGNDGQPQQTPQQKVEYVKQEKTFLAKLSGSAWVVRLLASFQDKDNVYMVMPLAHGGMLHGLIQQRKEENLALPTPLVRAWRVCGQVVLVAGFLTPCCNLLCSWGSYFLP
jgi:serine/threonine protein kinase